MGSVPSVELVGVQTPTGYLQFENRRAIQVEFDPESGMFVALDPAIGIDCYNRSLLDLYSDIAEQVEINFSEYALVADSVLTQDAKRLKQSLLAMVA